MAPNLEKSLKSPLIVVIVLAILVIAFWGLWIAAEGSGVVFLPAAIAGGIQVNSISSIPQIVSNDPKFQLGESWAVDYTLSEFASQQLVGLTNKEDIRDVGTNAAFDFEFTATMDRQSCNYPIEATGDNIYTYSWNYMQSPDGDNVFNLFTEGAAIEETLLECVQDLNGIYAYENRFGPFDSNVLCFKRTKASSIGTIKAPVALFEATTTVRLNGKNYVDTIKSVQKTSSNFYEEGELVAYSIWQGDLWSGRNCPSTADYRASFRNGKWTVISEDKFTEYIANVPTSIQFKNCIENPGLGEPTGKIERFDWCTNRYNNYPNLALSTPNVILESDLGGVTLQSTQLIDSTGTENQGQFVVDLTRPISFPKFTLYVKKDFVQMLGIRQEVGVPKILEVSPKIDTMTGKINMISVEVQNTGDTSGGFNLYTYCDKYGLQYGDSQKFTLDAGQAATVDVPLTVSCSILSEGDCKIVMESSVDVLLQDEKSFGVTCLPLKECTTPGEQRCEGQSIRECGEDFSWHVIDTCPIDCTEIQVGDTIRASCTGVPMAPSICGNGVCDPGEASSFFGLLPGSCPSDCEAESNTLFIGFLILFLGVTLYVAMRGYRPPQPYNWIFLIAGLLAGFASIYVLKVIIDSILWIALGLTGVFIVLAFVGGIPLLISIATLISPRAGTRVAAARAVYRQERKR